MTDSAVPGFPNSAQTDYARISKAGLPGTLWSEEQWNARPLNGLFKHVDQVAFTKTFTLANGTADGDVGINLAGGIIKVPAGVDDTANAAALSAAIIAAGFSATYIASSVPAAAVITVIGVLGQDPTITPVEEGSTTLVIGVTEAAVVQSIVCFGEGVVAYDDSTVLNPHKFKRPSALTDKFLGVVLRLNGSQLPAGQLAEYDSTLSPDNLLAGRSYSVERADAGVIVDYIGDAPGILDDVYHIMTGDNAGKWAKTDGAGSKVVTLTATSVADGLIGFSLEGLPALSLTATANATNDATSLYGQLIASPAYQALFTDYTTDAVDNVDGTLTLTFAPGLDPAFVDTSTGTSAVAQVVDVVVIAANAVAHPEYSWGRPSILASGDLPARAFLLLSRS